MFLGRQLRVVALFDSQLLFGQLAVQQQPCALIRVENRPVCWGRSDQCHIRYMGPALLARLPEQSHAQLLPLKHLKQTLTESLELLLALLV